MLTKHLLLAILWGGISLSHAALPLSGKFFTDFYVPTQPTSNQSIQQLSTSVWVLYDPQFSASASGRLELAANELFTSSVLGSTQLQFSVREGFLGFQKSGWDLRAGKMILPWGKTDGINPTDFLTAKDFTFFNPDEEARRIGSTSFYTSFTPQEGSSPFTFTFVATPFMPQSTLLVSPSRIPSTVSIDSTKNTPAVSLANTETALKVAYAGNQWDASLVLFRGWNHLPYYDVRQITLTTPTSVSTTIQENFHRIRSLGNDFSISLGNWVLREESAYVWTENDSSQNPLIVPSFLSTVLGAERPLSDDFRIQLQFLFRYYPGFASPDSYTGSNLIQTSVYREVGKINSLIQNYTDAFRPAATFRLAYSNDKIGLDSDLFILANFVGGDYLVRPQVSYRWTDALKSVLGLDYYGGPNDRPLGMLATYNSVFTELKFVF